jgi:hypothetical protein
MSMTQRLSTWRRRFREYRIRERESTRAARERVEQADRAVNLAGLKRTGGGSGGI